MSDCRVCGLPVYIDKLCRECYQQREAILAIRRQKKRDKEFGNIFEEAGVRDE